MLGSSTQIIPRLRKIPELANKAQSYKQNPIIVHQNGIPPTQNPKTNTLFFFLLVLNQNYSKTSSTNPIKQPIFNRMKTQICQINQFIQNPIFDIHSNPPNGHQIQ